MRSISIIACVLLVSCGTEESNISEKTFSGFDNIAGTSLPNPRISSISVHKLSGYPYKFVNDRNNRLVVLDVNGAVISDDILAELGVVKGVGLRNSDFYVVRAVSAKRIDIYRRVDNFLVLQVKTGDNPQDAVLIDENLLIANTNDSAIGLVRISY